MSIALEILDEFLKPKTEYFSEKQYPDAIQAEVLRLKKKRLEFSHKEPWLRLEKGNLESLICSEKLDAMEKKKPQAKSSDTLAPPTVRINGLARPTDPNSSKSRFPQKLGDIKIAKDRIIKLKNEILKLTDTMQLLENQLQKLEKLQQSQQLQLSQELNKLNQSQKSTISKTAANPVATRNLSDKVPFSETIHAPRKPLPSIPVINFNLSVILNQNTYTNPDSAANANDNTDNTQQNPTPDSGTPRIGGMAINSNSDSATPRVTGVAITSTTQNVKVASDSDSETPRMNRFHGEIPDVTMQLPTKNDNTNNVNKNDHAERQPALIDTTQIRFDSFSTTVFFSNPIRPKTQRGSKPRSCLKSPTAPPPTARQDADSAPPASSAALPAALSNIHANSNGKTDSEKTTEPHLHNANDLGERGALQSPRTVGFLN